MEAREDFVVWKQVLELTELIQEINKQGPLTRQELADLIDSVQARVDDYADPLEHFELYVLGRLCRALQSSVTSGLKL